MTGEREGGGVKGLPPFLDMERGGILWVEGVFQKDWALVWDGIDKQLIVREREREALCLVVV